MPTPRAADAPDARDKPDTPDKLEAMEPVERPYEDHTSTSDDDAANLTPEHRAYLVARHGTADLDPVPAADDADPLNWPRHLKLISLVLVAFHAMMATFTAAAIQPAFHAIAADLGVSVQRASYLTSLQIAVLGGGPLLWRPLAHAYGRRPVFLASLLCSAVCNIGCAQSHSFATMGLCRALNALFICPPMSIGSGVVSDMFFRKDRGLYMGVWATMVTLGVPTAPFLFGFVTLRVSYRWIYYILAMTNGVQLVLYVFFGRESRYVPGTTGLAAAPTTAPVQTYLTFRRIDPTPIRAADFVRPLFLAARPCVVVPAVAYAMVFLWGSIMISLEIPQLFPASFGFNAQQVGLQYLALIVGTVLGEQVGGRVSDAWMWRRRRRGHLPPPEYRLWLSYIGFALTLCGVIVFLVQLEDAGARWNVTPLVGAAIASAGNQIVTTVMITYAVDCYRDEAASIGVFVTFVRQMWGFIGPFWFPQMLANAGLVRSVGIPLALIVVASIAPVMLLQWRGSQWR